MPISPALKELAEAAAKLAGGKTVDETLEMFVESIESERKSLSTFAEIFANFPLDTEAAWTAYAEAVGHPPLTQEEKQQAFLNHILAINQNRR